MGDLDDRDGLLLEEQLVAGEDLLEEVLVDLRRRWQIVLNCMGVRMRKDMYLRCLSR